MRKQGTDQDGKIYYPLPNRFYTRDPHIANLTWILCGDDPGSFDPHLHTELWEISLRELRRGAALRKVTPKTLIENKQNSPIVNCPTEFQDRLAWLRAEEERIAARVDRRREEEYQLSGRIQGLRAAEDFLIAATATAEEARVAAIQAQQAATGPPMAFTPQPIVVPAPTPSPSGSAASYGTATGPQPQQCSRFWGQENGSGARGGMAANMRGHENAPAGSNPGGSNAAGGSQASGPPASHVSSGAQFVPLPVPQGYNRDALMGRAGPRMPVGTAPNVPFLMKYYTYQGGLTVDFGRFPRLLADRFAGPADREIRRLSRVSEADVSFLALPRAHIANVPYVTLRVTAPAQGQLHAGVYASHHHLLAKMTDPGLSNQTVQMGRACLQAMANFTVQLDARTMAPGPTRMGATTWR